VTNTIYTILGLTGAGKTELANYLETVYSIKHVHPIRRLKDHYEEVINKPAGFLDTKEGKAYVPPGCTHTMQEIMVAEYHFKQQYMPNYSALSLASLLPKYLTEGSVGLVSIRNEAEVNVVKSLQELGHRHVHVPLYRSAARAETSDGMFNVLNAKLINISDAVYGINNNGSLSELYLRADEMIYDERVEEDKKAQELSYINEQQFYDERYVGRSYDIYGMG